MATGKRISPRDQKVIAQRESEVAETRRKLEELEAKVREARETADYIDSNVWPKRMSFSTLNDNDEYDERNAFAEERAGFDPNSREAGEVARAGYEIEVFYDVDERGNCTFVGAISYSNGKGQRIGNTELLTQAERDAGHKPWSWNG